MDATHPIALTVHIKSGTSLALLACCRQAARLYRDANLPVHQPSPATSDTVRRTAKRSNVANGGSPARRSQLAGTLQAHVAACGLDELVVGQTGVRMRPVRHLNAIDVEPDVAFFFHVALCTSRSAVGGRLLSASTQWQPTGHRARLLLQDC